jgi:hypothetical protein
MIDFSAIADIGHNVFGVDATFIDQGTLAQTAISVVKVAPEKFANFGFNEHIIPTLIVNVRVSEIAEIVAGDQITINSIAYTVIGDPEKDSQQLLWTVRLSQ